VGWDVRHRRIRRAITIKVAVVGERRRAVAPAEVEEASAAASDASNASIPAPSGADPDLRGDAVGLHARLPDFRGRERGSLPEVDVGADRAYVARPARDEADVVLGEDPGERWWWWWCFLFWKRDGEGKREKRKK